MKFTSPHKMKAAHRFITCFVLAIFAFTSCSISQTPASRSKPVVALPFASDDDGIIFLNVRADGSAPMLFALDSGASFPFVVDSRLAQLLKLKLNNSRTFASGAGPAGYTVSDADGVTIQLGDLSFPNRAAKVLALDSLESIAGHRLDGLIGQDLFRHYVIEINYADRIVILHDPQTYTYNGTGESLPLTDEENYFYISARISMAGRAPADARLLVDTGGGFVSVVLNAPFARSNGWPAPDQKTILDRSLAGLGGEMRLLVGRGSSLAVGKMTILDPVVYISQDTAGALTSRDFDGVLGSRIFQRFKAIFDVPHGRLILEPNSAFQQPFEYDMSGIRLRAEGRGLNKFRVFQVIENSPAARAGVKEGDVLTEIDGIPASKLSLAKIYEMFKQPNRLMRLRLRRGAETLLVSFRLERMI